MRLTVAFACAVMLVGCAREEPVAESAAPTPRTDVESTPAPNPVSPASIDPLPARYSGVLPCADCAGIRYEVDLRPANVYLLRMTYLGTTPERTYDDIGAWSVASDLHTIALRGARQSPQLFAIVGEMTLRKLNNEGQPIESELNYALTREQTYAPLTPLVPLRGMYSKTATGGLFEECTTGLKLEVAAGSNDALQQEFESLRKGDRPVLLAMEGRVEIPAGAASAGTLTASSTAKFWPGESCGARGVTHDLEGSRWVLVRVGERSVTAQEGKAEPYIVLQAASKEIAGHGGCNRLSGAYRIDGETLELGELTTTRMACAESETEHAFLNALESVMRWRLMDNQLVLLDKNNSPVLQLESRNL